MYSPNFSLTSASVNLIAEISSLAERFDLRLEREDSLRLRGTDGLFYHERQSFGLLIRTKTYFTIKAAEENGGTKTVLAIENPTTPVETPVQNSQTPVETPVQNESHKLDTVAALLEIIKQEPHITMKKAAVVISRSVSATERCAVRLQKEGRLKYIGAIKGGCWKVID